MFKIIKTNMIYLFLYFTITLLSCFVCEVFFFEWNALQNYKSNQSIFVMGWLLLFFMVLGFFLNKLKISPTFFFSACVIWGPIMYFLGIIISMFLNIDKTKIINHNYIGTYVQTEKINSNQDGTNTENHNSYVFNKNDKSLTKEINRLDEEFEVGVSKDKFIFWQTAMAKGFEPKNIKGYQGRNDFSYNQVLYTTAGPLTILELLITASQYAISLLIFPLIGFLFRKRLFFDNLDDIIKFSKEMSKK